MCLDPNGLTNEGTLFAVAFLANVPPPLDSRSSAVVYVLNKNQQTAIVEVSLPNNPTFPDYPQTVSIEPNSKHVFKFATGRNGAADIRVMDPLFSQNRGIRVNSTNNVPVTVIGSNSEEKSTDAFLALPCQRVAINRYKYFVFASSSANTLSSQFIALACEDDTTITYNVDSRAGSENLNAFEAFSLADRADYTGGIIESNKPLAVFSGHACGNIPEDVSACDILVEQIPMHTVWGTTFFTSPFGYRGSGESYRVGSILDDNIINVTCTRRNGTDTSTQVRLASSISAGEYYEFETVSSPVGASRTNYRRDFCCIETSKPAIVMQYMPSHSLDETNLGSIGLGIGDPSMTTIPPVEQYRSDFIATTLDITPITEDFTNMISWTIPSVFFEPSTNTNEVFFDNSVLAPGNFLPSQGGSGEYIPIQCSNGEICGYGAYSTKDAYPGINFQLYGYVPEMSYMYAAGFEMEPIGSKSNFLSIFIM